MADPPPPYSYQPGPPQYHPQQPGPPQYHPQQPLPPHAYPQAHQRPPPPLAAAPPPANYGATYNYPPPPPGHVTVVQQPVAVVAHPQQVKPENYLILSVVTMLFCCFICGLIALIFSLQVDSAYSQGDHEGARRAARTAKNLNIAGIVSGIAIAVVSGVLVVIMYVGIAVAAGLLLLGVQAGLLLRDLQVLDARSTLALLLAAGVFMAATLNCCPKIPEQNRS